MNWSKSLDGFQFDSDPVFDKQIDAADVLELKAVIFERDRHLPRRAQTAPLKFSGKYGVSAPLRENLPGICRGTFREYSRTVSWFSGTPPLEAPKPASYLKNVRVAVRRPGEKTGLCPSRERPNSNAFGGLTMRFDFSPLSRSTVGFDRLFDTLGQVAQYDAGHAYPPYNIERTSENRYRVTVAVAGFGEKDLNVEVKDGVLTIVGKQEDSEKSEGKSVLYRGIAGRAFERRFQLADHVEVRGAKLENGLLHVDLEQIVPEEKKPRRIQINGPELKAIEGQAKAA
jgi:molecular chaperone IbpA